MGFKCGIVGLPNVGKSTLFNALTQTAAAQAANYPFCTIEPNIGDVGVPDPRLGEAIHAVVVPKTNAVLTPEGLRRWASRRIERYKVPDAIYLRDALPLGSTGKVRRAGVAELALAIAKAKQQ